MSKQKVVGRWWEKGRRMGGTRVGGGGGCVDQYLARREGDGVSGRMRGREGDAQGRKQKGRIENVCVRMRYTKGRKEDRRRSTISERGR